MYRRLLLPGLGGRVVEVGAGTGIHFQHYPANVAEVVAVEPEPNLRAAAQAAARDAPVDVRVLSELAEALPTPDASVDAGVSAGLLCSVPDPAGGSRGVGSCDPTRRRAALLRARDLARDRRAATLQRALDASGVWARGSAAVTRAATRRRRSRAPGFASSRSSASRFTPRCSTFPWRRRSSGGRGESSLVPAESQRREGNVSASNAELPPRPSPAGARTTQPRCWMSSTRTASWWCRIRSLRGHLPGTRRGRCSARAEPHGSRSSSNAKASWSANATPPTRLHQGRGDASRSRSPARSRANLPRPSARTSSRGSASDVKQLARILVRVQATRPDLQ